MIYQFMIGCRHIPHHVTVKIPWYNLRRATYALMRQYGDKLHTVEMSLELWMEVTTQCHVWDEKEAYKKLEM
jgi:omega-6 fatty acid desaturase (delta-12 desaturase)